MKISVITVCRNARTNIEGAIDSVLAQTYGDVEYIIVDGASTDGTRALVERYRPYLAAFVSEQDRGIYDAMNKGLKLATGDVIHFLNSDDRYPDIHVLEDIAACFMESPTSEIVYGKAIYTNIPEQAKKTFHLQDAQYHSFRDAVFERVTHQCFFVRRALFRQVGMFDTSFCIFADYVWFLRAYRIQAKIYFLNRDVVVFSVGGMSYTSRYRAIPEKIRAVWGNTSFGLFLEYLLMASKRKIIHIFQEEIHYRVDRYISISFLTKYCFRFFHGKSKI